MMNCVIIDDDSVARLDMEHKISHVSFLKLFRSCSSAVEAKRIIMNAQIDLIILDVMMPEMNGFQLMDTLKVERPQIILISSNNEFAVSAFDFDVTDFLEKPVSNERFFRAIAKARRLHEMRTGIASYDDNHIFLKINSRLIKIDMRDIHFIEAMADYVTVHTSNNKYTIHSTMKGVENSLSFKHFFRAHNSFIIRLDKISAIEDNCVVIEKKLIPVSRSKIKTLMQSLKLVI